MAKPPKKKILVNVWQPLIAKLNEMIEAACLQRDAYLDHVFRHEAGMLDQEIDTPNSDAARNLLAKHLGLLNKKPVNFALSPETVASIDEVCKRKNVLRDSFINRVLLFLIAVQDDVSRGFFAQLLPPFPNQIDHVFTATYNVDIYTSGPLFAIAEIVSDNPFWPIRCIIEEANRWSDTSNYPSLYNIFIPPNFFGENVNVLGLNCYLPDSTIDKFPVDSESVSKLLDIKIGKVQKRDKKERVSTEESRNKQKQEVSKSTQSLENNTSEILEGDHNE